MTKNKPIFCVDLDGVIAKYYGFKSIYTIEEPFPDSKAFLERLMELGEVIIYTSRLSESCFELAKKEITNSRDLYGEQDDLKFRVYLIVVREVIENYFKRYNLPYSSIYYGKGKPYADYYLDDRAITVRRQDNDRAFELALQVINLELEKNNADSEEGV